MPTNDVLHPKWRLRDLCKAYASATWDIAMAASDSTNNRIDELRYRRAQAWTDFVTLVDEVTDKC